MSSTDPQRIVIIGAECTGKTTLTRTIAGQLAEPWSHEYVREYVDTVKRALRADDLDAIARGQLKCEDTAAASAYLYVLHDTNLLSSILYAEHYFDTHIPWVDEVFARRRYHHYFLCEPDFPWLADPGQRESPKERARLQGCFESILHRYEIPFVRLSGSLEERSVRVMQSLQPKS